MPWQDLVLSVGSFVLSIALIPSIMSKDKPALSTSLMTGTVIGIFSVVYLTLELWLATITTAAGAGLWMVLAFQKYREKK